MPAAVAAAPAAGFAAWWTGMPMISGVWSASSTSPKIGLISEAVPAVAAA